MPLNLPNLITWLRIIMIPLIIGVFYLPDAWLSFTGKNVAACAIFVVAALSDWCRNAAVPWTNTTTG